MIHKLSKLHIKLLLLVVTCLVLIGYNYQAYKSSQSSAQKVYKEWLSNFEAELRKDSSKSHRQVLISLQIPSTTGGPTKRLQLNTTKPEISQETVERLLELILESGVYNWGSPIQDTQQSIQDIQLIISANDYNSSLLVPLSQVEKSIIFQNFLKLMQIHAS